MKKVAIVSAMDEETEYIHQYITDRPGWNKTEENTYTNDEKQLQLFVKVLGVGKVNAAFQTADVVNQYHPDLLVNIGVSGGLAQNVKRGTVAIGKSYVQTDFKPFIKDNLPVIKDTSEWIVSGLEKAAKEKNYDYLTGKLATGDFFLHDENERASIIKDFNPISFDMETAAIAQVATAKDTEFAAIRIFSDLANEDATIIAKHEIDTEEEKEIRHKLNTKPTELLVSFLEAI